MVKVRITFEYIQYIQFPQCITETVTSGDAKGWKVQGQLVKKASGDRMRTHDYVFGWLVESPEGTREGNYI